MFYVHDCTAHAYDFELLYKLLLHNMKIQTDMNFWICFNLSTKQTTNSGHILRINCGINKVTTVNVKTDSSNIEFVDMLGII